MNTFAKKIASLALAALVVGGAASASISPAAAGGWDHHWNAPLAGGLLGGLVLGSVISGANAQGSYYDDAPVYECHRERRAVLNEYGDFVGYRRVRVCN